MSYKKEKWQEQIGKMGVFDNKCIFNIYSNTKVVKYGNREADDNCFRIVDVKYHYVLIASSNLLITKIPKRYVKII